MARRGYRVGIVQRNNSSQVSGVRLRLREIAGKPRRFIEVTWSHGSGAAKRRGCTHIAADREVLKAAERAIVLRVAKAGDFGLMKLSPRQLWARLSAQPVHLERR